MKSILIVLIFFLSPVALASADSLQLANKRDSIVHYAQTFLDSPYLWGGSTANGFDCSGFVYHVFTHFDVAVSRTSRGHKGTGEIVELNAAKPGDIILFTGSNAAIRKIGHVGIVLKNTDGIIDFIHSSSSKKHYGVTITRYNNSGYVKRFMHVINVLK